MIKLIEIPVMLAAAGGVLTGTAAVLLALLFAMGIVAAFFGRSNTRSCRIFCHPKSCCSATRWSKPGPLSRSSSARSPAWL
jgi:pyridoxal biosynthesis lyase PdxS